MVREVEVTRVVPQTVVLEVEKPVEVTRIVEQEVEAIRLDWALRISSGVSQGIYKSVVQSDREFLRIRVGGGP